MANLTTKFLFNLPLVNNAIDADLWGGQLNSNWTAIDTDLAPDTSLETADFNVTAQHNAFYSIDASGSAVTATLPSSGIIDGFTVYIKATDVTNAITIDGNGNNIDGATTKTLDNENDAVALIYDGSNWLIFAANLTVNAANQTEAGIIEIATTAEAEAGTDDTRAMTPKKVREAIFDINTTYGGLGSYVFAWTSDNSVAQNSTASGSTLEPAGILPLSTQNPDDTNATAGTAKGGAALSGTWRAMFRQDSSSASNGSTGLWVRIL